ncbi:bestrophin-like domain [Streptomyces sp. IBSBF 2435]|uniref:bestrophin-like domain n=1 Tax=Streptomyces sp. IBSBF 2435 TaxID=2903531 RepID=UPI002FDC79D5
MSPYAVPLLTTLGGAAFAFCLGRFLGRGRVTAEGDYGSQALSIIGAVLLSSFILLTGFQVAGSWSALSTARSGTYDEARALTDAYWAAGGLAAADRTTVRGLLRRYTADVRTVEFPELRHGRTSPATWQALDRVRGAVRGAVAVRPDQQAAKTAAQSALATVYETRTDRAAAAKAGIPRIIWLAMVVSGSFLVAFPAVLGLTATPRHLVALCFAAAAVAFAISLTAQLNHPFREPFGAGRTAFVFAETRFGQMDAPQR